MIRLVPHVIFFLHVEEKPGKILADVGGKMTWHAASGQHLSCQRSYRVSSV